ncbi:hypothetical protein [Anaplasma ovis]|nr:hypothetical protein [Anaplasma ovis]
MELGDEVPEVSRWCQELWVLIMPHWVPSSEIGNATLGASGVRR